MIPRTAADTARRLARGFPIVALTGPRQSGKTTLARALFSDKPYVSLEDPVERDFATRDPRSFLARYAHGGVLDEAQRAPELFSYLQGVVDARNRMGEFVLTGSQQFGLTAGITQSLAGRAGLVHLLPFSLAELERVGLRPASLEQALWHGGYPPLHDRRIAPGDWFSNYVATYVERDVHQLLAVRDLGLFQRFLGMCAARTGHLLNLSSLASDCGITHVTARQWLSVLEASYVVVLLRPYHSNFGKRLVKTPKLYFVDVGLAAWLLGIRDAEALQTHAQRGALFESLVISEVLKHEYNAGRRGEMYFWRDSAGHEIDLLLPVGDRLQPIEIKSGRTFSSDWSAQALYWARLVGDLSLPPIILYGGSDRYEREGCRVVGWRDLALPAAAPAKVKAGRSFDPPRRDRSPQ